MSPCGQSYHSHGSLGARRAPRRTAASVSPAAASIFSTRLVVERGRPAIHDRERARLEREPCDRPDLERRADDEHEPRATRELGRTLHRAGGRSSPKRTTPGLSTSPHCGQLGIGALLELREHGVGGLRPQATRDTAPSGSSRAPRPRRVLPARVCSVSMFWVTTACTRPRRSSSASARCAAFGSASRSRWIRSR